MTKKKIRFSPTNNSKVTFEGNKYTNTFEFPIFGGEYWYRIVLAVQKYASF